MKTSWIIFFRNFVLGNDVADVDAIRVNNLYFKATGSNLRDKGRSHSPDGTPMKENVNRIPDYLKEFNL